MITSVGSRIIIGLCKAVALNLGKAAHDVVHVSVALAVSLGIFIRPLESVVVWCVVAEIYHICAVDVVAVVVALEARKREQRVECHPQHDACCDNFD